MKHHSQWKSASLALVLCVLALPVFLGGCQKDAAQSGGAAGLTKAEIEQIRGANQLQDKIKSALQREGATISELSIATTPDGTVVVTGHTRSDSTRQRAGEIIARVEGVKKLENAIMIE